MFPNLSFLGGEIMMVAAGADFRVVKGDYDPECLVAVIPRMQ